MKSGVHLEVALRIEPPFHYPTFKQWRTVVEPSASWADDDVFAANQSGNVFCAGSDSLAQHWMFGKLDGERPREAVVPMIDSLIDMIGKFNSLVEDVLGAFIAARLVSADEAAKPVGSVLSPQFDVVRLPFWTHMPKAG
ncbi:MAG: hypothetical protein AD742_03280 [Methylibium sp. NZG]|nr:MAG: hypothetical protein AD742_03280 [Methylibium sp. NZG]